MGIGLVLNASLILESVFCVRYLRKLELTQDAEMAAAQDPHAWPRPCPSVLGEMLGLCIYKLGQVVAMGCVQSQQIQNLFTLN